MQLDINVDPEELDKIVANCLHESIRTVASFHGYSNYPEDAAQDLAALSRVYQFYTGKTLENYK